MGISVCVCVYVVCMFVCVFVRVRVRVMGRIGSLVYSVSPPQVYRVSQTLNFLCVMNSTAYYVNKSHSTASESQRTHELWCNARHELVCTVCHERVMCFTNSGVIRNALIY